MDEANELFVRLQSEAGEHIAVKGKPSRKPAGAIAERGRSCHDVHGACACRHLLLPRRYLGMWFCKADDADHQWRIGQTPLLDVDLGRRRIWIFPGKDAGNDVAGARTRIALENDKAPR